MAAWKAVILITTPAPPYSGTQWQARMAANGYLTNPLGCHMMFPGVFMPWRLCVYTGHFD